MKKQSMRNDAMDIDRTWFGAHPDREYRLRVATNEERAQFGAPYILVRQVWPGVRFRQGVTPYAELNKPESVPESQLAQLWSFAEKSCPDLAELTAKLIAALAIYKAGRSK